jgi:hypothetical protein
MLPILGGKVIEPRHYDMEYMVRDDMHLLNEQIQDDIWKHADLLIKKAKGKDLKPAISPQQFRHGICYNVVR